MRTSTPVVVARLGPQVAPHARIRPMPSPTTENLRVRLPRALAGRLRELADEQGVSINTLMVALLAGTTGFSLAPPPPSPEPEPDNTAPADVLAEIRTITAAVKWSYARTMPQSPHDYAVREQCAKVGREDQFERVVTLIREHGYARTFGSTTYTYLNVDGRRLWTMGSPLSETTILNRAVLQCLRCGAQPCPPPCITGGDHDWPTELPEGYLRHLQRQHDKEGTTR
jgi:hypothetical protein